MFRPIKVSLAIILRTRAFWALVFAQLATEWSLHMLVYIVPLFLRDTLHIDVYTFFVSCFLLIFCEICSLIVCLINILRITSTIVGNISMPTERMFML